MATANHTTRGKLTAKQCESLSAGKYNDGLGLWLHVSATGARKWVLRYTLDGKRREMGLGPTFISAAAAFIRANRRGWANRKHARQWISTMRAYAGPVIGAKAVDSITTDEVLRLLSPIWSTKPETAKRVQGRLERIIDHATARGWRKGDNPARWRGHLDALLAPTARVKRNANGGTDRHHPAMPFVEVPAFLVELRKLDSISAMALEFLILTAARTGEVLGAQWQEIDVEARTWTVPASRMKAKREHRVPLSDSAMALLERVPRVMGTRHVFPGARAGRPLSNMALLQCLRGLGYGQGGELGDAVPHGFRSSFRDWAEETTGHPHNVVEMALAHTIGSKVEAAYRRGDLFAKRRALMSDWADWCQRKPADIVPLRAEIG
jgi:integrase